VQLSEVFNVSQINCANYIYLYTFRCETITYLRTTPLWIKTSRFSSAVWRSAIFSRTCRKSLWTRRAIWNTWSVR